MSNFHVLNEQEWEKVQSLMHWLPEKKERGTKRSDFRKVWNSILYVIVHQSRWGDIPKDPSYAHRSSAHRWLLRWEENGVLTRVLKGLYEIGYFKNMLDRPLEAAESLMKSMKRRSRGSDKKQEEPPPPPSVSNFSTQL